MKSGVKPPHSKEFSRPFHRPRICFVTLIPSDKSLGYFRRPLHGLTQRQRRAMQ
jgi:hypothetical protein